MQVQVLEGLRVARSRKASTSSSSSSSSNVMQQQLKRSSSSSPTNRRSFLARSASTYTGNSSSSSSATTGGSASEHSAAATASAGDATAAAATAAGATAAALEAQQQQQWDQLWATAATADIFAAMSRTGAGGDAYFALHCLFCTEVCITTARNTTTARLAKTVSLLLLLLYRCETSSDAAREQFKKKTHTCNTSDTPVLLIAFRAVLSVLVAGVTLALSSISVGD
jgi:hypothetical protein